MIPGEYLLRDDEIEINAGRATAGIGWDRFTGSAQAQDAANFDVTADDFSNDRTTIFGNLSWTMLILNIVGEGGVQKGGPDDTYYGSLAVRIAL